MSAFNDWAWEREKGDERPDRASFEAGVAYGKKQTPLQSAALAALVAWRKADEAWLASPRYEHLLAMNLNNAERDLRAASDALIAAEVTE